MFQRVQGKFKGMRSAKNWTVYPHSKEDQSWIIQTDNKIAKVFSNGKAIVSKTKKGIGFVGLSSMLGAVELDAPIEIVNQLNELLSTGPRVRIL